MHMDQKNKKILLVEDDDALANVYMMRFESEGFELRRVSNGEEALSETLEFAGSDFA